MLHSLGTLLVIGHAASGKSAWAEAEVLRAVTNARPIYVATARGDDIEMRAKISAHAARRGAEWSLIEAPEDLAATCAARAAEEVVLIDCATMWLANLTMGGDGWQVPAEAWIAAMAASPARFVVVTNDVGGGIVPANAMARAFQHAQGALNQRLAAAIAGVVTVTAGLPLWLKGGPRA